MDIPGIGSNTAAVEKSMAYVPTDIETAVIAIVRQEKAAWEDAAVFVTDKVSFQMRNLIRLLRKNYWGIFQDPFDPVTGDDKIWVGLTEFMVETIVKNIDLDTKDISFTAKNASEVGMAKLVREIVKDALDKMNFERGSTFGEKLDLLERDLEIDGTKVWKTLGKYDEHFKARTLHIMEPDLLNLYVDPTVDSIQAAYRFTERARLTEAEVKSYAKDGWINTKYVKGYFGIPLTDPTISTSSSPGGNGAKYVDVWETWGKGPNWLMTGKTGNTDEDENEVDLHLVLSGLERPGNVVVHMVETYDGVKPYEEAWSTKITGRWYGKGTAEKVMWLQLWMNIVVNIRITRAKIAQLGIFKIKKGSGITPQMISRMPNNGAIMVNSMDDIEQMVMEEVGQTSYTDETNINTWAQRITGAFEVVTGEGLPADTPATNAALQSTSARSGFTIKKESLGMFLKRWLQRHALPVIMANVKQADIVRLSGDVDDLRVWDNSNVNWMLVQQIEDMNARGIVVDVPQVMREKLRLLEEYQQHGRNRFHEINTKIDISLYDVDITITNEEMDTGVVAQNLLAALKINPQLANQVMPQLFDIMGLNFQAPQNQQVQQGLSPGGPQPPQGPTQNPGVPMPSAMPSQNALQPIMQANTQ